MVSAPNKKINEYVGYFARCKSRSYTDGESSSTKAIVQILSKFIEIIYGFSSKPKINEYVSYFARCRSCSYTHGNLLPSDQAF